MSKVPTIALAFAAPVLFLTACGASGDQVASNCHAGVEGSIQDRGYVADLDYASTSVVEDTDRGGYDVEGMAFDNQTGNKVWFNCRMDYDGEYVSSSWNVT